MRNQGFRPIIAILSILLLTGAPAQAAPVAINEVVQVLSNYRNPPDLRIRTVSQNPAQAGPSRTQFPADSSRLIVDTSLGSMIEPPSDSLLAGVVMDQDPQKVDVIVQGDVEATICDCGEITIPVGGFPRWPLFFLGVIPFLFLPKGDEEPVPPLPPFIPPTITEPTPTPPVSTVPEPASLLLFATGLAAFGAGLRRRYTQSKSVTQIQATEED